MAISPANLAILFVFVMYTLSSLCGAVGTIVKPPTFKDPSGNITHMSDFDKYMSAATQLAFALVCGLFAFLIYRSAAGH